MRHAFILILTIGLSVASEAQMVPRHREETAVKDPTMVVGPKHGQLEVFENKQVVVRELATGASVIASVTEASRTAPLSGKNPALVFNHAMQMYGYATGEIAFRLKGGAPLGSGFPQYELQGVKKFGKFDFYVYQATSEKDFVRVVSFLNDRFDVDWVNPTVRYLPMISGQQGN